MPMIKKCKNCGTEFKCRRDTERKKRNARRKSTRIFALTAVELLRQNRELQSFVCSA